MGPARLLVLRGGISRPRCLVVIVVIIVVVAAARGSVLVVVVIVIIIVKVHGVAARTRTGSGQNTRGSSRGPSVSH
jgi:hypothetical protein